MSGEDDMMLLGDNMHPAASGWIYQGCIWIDPSSSASEIAHPTAICYLHCILRSCRDANRGWVNVNVKNIHEQRTAVSNTDAGLCVSKRFAVMDSWQTRASPSANPMMRTSPQMQTSTSKWKAAATAARVKLRLDSITGCDMRWRC
jgi:hypothetical protein